MAISITQNNSVLLNSINVNVDDNQYYKYVSNELITFKKDSYYEVSFRSISNVVEPLVLFVTSSGGTDAFDYDSKFGNPVLSPLCTVNTLEDHKNVFKADYDGTGYLCFAFKYGNYYISEIKVLPYQGINYSPDNAIITIPTPESKRNEKISISIIYKSADGLRVGDPESYLSNSGYPITETDYGEVTGSNLLISNDDNLIEGSLFVGKSLRSGIEIAGTNSAFIRSIGFQGFQSASLGLASPGFMIYSGSVLPNSGDGYSGVGMDMILSSDKYFRFRTIPGELDVHTDSIFIGNIATNYISASGGILEISSSNFLLSSSGDVRVQGTIYADAGKIAGLYIKSASIQNNEYDYYSSLFIGSSSKYYDAANLNVRRTSLIRINSVELNLDHFIHDSDLYNIAGGGPPSNPANHYISYGGTYITLNFTSSAAYGDIAVNSNGFMRIFSGSNSVNPNQYYNVSGFNAGDVISIDTQIGFFANVEMECYGYGTFNLEFFDENDISLKLESFPLYNKNLIKGEFSLNRFEPKFIIPDTATKFKFWYDFYRSNITGEELTSVYRLYYCHILSNNLFIEVSPSGFFYYFNDNKYVKLGKGHYEIKGTEIESDKFNAIDYVFIGSGSYETGMLHINQYIPDFSSGILQTYNNNKIYRWIAGTGTVNEKIIVISDAPITSYYNLYGDDVLIYNIYKDITNKNTINLGNTKLQFSSSNYLYSDDSNQIIFNSYSPDGKYYKFLYNDENILDIYSSSATGYNKNIVEITASVKVEGSMYLNHQQGGSTNSGEVLTFSKNVTAAAGITATSSLKNDLIHSGSITLISGACRLYTNKEYTGFMYRYELPNSTTFYTSSTLASPDANSYIKNNSINYVVVEYNNGDPRYRITQNVEEINESDIFPVYTMYRTGSVINWIDWGSLGRGLPNRLHQRLIKTQRFAREDGLELYTDSSIIGITSGRAWVGAVRHAFELVESDISNTQIYYRNSSNTWASEAIAGFDNTRWNNLSTYTLDSLSPNSYNVNWIYRNMVDYESQYATSISIILGNHNKSTIDEILSVSPPSTLPPDISAMSVLVGKIIVKQGVTDAIEIYSAWTTSFIGSGVGGSGGGGGTFNHNDLLGLQGGSTNQYYHSTYAEYTGTGTGVFVRENSPRMAGAVNISGSLTATNIYETSDERLKNNIRLLENQCDNVLKLNPKRFNFIKNESKEEIGLIAQEVREIYPEFVNQSDDGMLSIDYSKLSVVLIKSLHEMNEKNINMENKINELENKIELLFNFLNK